MRYGDKMYIALGSGTAILAAVVSLLLAWLACSTARADIVSTVGLTQITAPSVVTGDFAVNSGLPNQLIFPEQQNIVLLQDLVTDTGTIAAGTMVNSYFVAVNRIPPEAIVDTRATFDRAVLGLVYLENPITGIPSTNFLGTDFLGAPLTLYLEASCRFCGFENLGQTQPLADTASFVGSTAFFHNNYSTPGDFARIITESANPVPGPIAGAGLPGLMALGLLWFARRRRARS